MTRQNDLRGVGGVIHAESSLRRSAFLTYDLRQSLFLARFKYIKLYNVREDAQITPPVARMGRRLADCLDSGGVRGAFVERFVKTDGPLPRLREVQNFVT